MLCFQQVLLCCLLVIMLFGQCHSYHLSTCRQWVAPRHTSNQSPSSAIVSSSPIPLMHSQRHSLRIHVLPTENQEAELFEMDPADAEHLAFLLANVSDAIEKSPELALSLASKNMGFLFSRNIPK